MFYCIAHGYSLLWDCLFQTIFLGWTIPSSLATQTNKKSYYIDVGAYIWDEGTNGPSLSYFTTMWGRHNNTFDKVFPFHNTESESVFAESVPAEWKNKTIYRKVMMSASSQTKNETSLFLPSFIRNTTKKEDYVLLKLDISRPSVDKKIISDFLEKTRFANGKDFDKAFS